MAAAAAKTGLSKRTLQTAKKRGCPAFKPRGSVDCDQLLKWLAHHPEVIQGAAESINRDFEITLRARAERQLKEHRLAVLRGDFVLAADVEKWVGEMVSQARRVLGSGPSSLAPLLVGVPIPEAEAILGEWIHDALVQLSTDTSVLKGGAR